MKLKVAFRNQNLLPYYSQIHFLQDVFTANRRLAVPGTKCHAEVQE